MESVMICQHKTRLLYDFSKLITPSRQSIITLFNIVQVTNLTSDFLASFKKFIIERSHQIFQEKKEPYELISDLISFKLYCDDL